MNHVETGCGTIHDTYISTDTPLAKQQPRSTHHAHHPHKHVRTQYTVHVHVQVELAHQNAPPDRHSFLQDAGDRRRKLLGENASLIFIFP